MRYNEQDAVDRAVIARVDQMSPEELATYDRWAPLELAHYLSEQKPWLEDEIYFLGIELGRCPTPAEVSECVLHGGHSLRFRAFYVLRFPDRVCPPSLSAA